MTKVAVQRCQWHKRESVVGHLPSSKHATYDRSDYGQAKTALKTVGGELGLLNRSALASPDEGFEETLTLHRLGLAKELARSFPAILHSPARSSSAAASCEVCIKTTSEAAIPLVEASSSHPGLVVELLGDVTSAANPGRLRIATQGPLPRSTTPE